MAKAKRRMRSDEGGQLMLLSGIVITIAFIMTSLTLSQISSLERQAAADESSGLQEEWRFLHERLATNLQVAITPETTITQLKATVFPTIVATFRNIEAEKGYDLVLRLAADTLSVNKTEKDLHDGATYKPTTWDAAGTTNYDPVAYDGAGDGVIYEASCPAEGTTGGCITGVLVFVHLHDGTSSIEEVILFAVNQE